MRRKRVVVRNDIPFPDKVKYFMLGAITLPTVLLSFILFSWKHGLFVTGLILFTWYAYEQDKQQ